MRASASYSRARVAAVGVHLRQAAAGVCRRRAAAVPVALAQAISHPAAVLAWVSGSSDIMGVGGNDTAERRTTLLIIDAESLLDSDEAAALKTGRKQESASTRRLSGS